MNCPLCERLDPHGHDLGFIRNGRHYCSDGERHEWMPRRWRRDVCARCGQKGSRR